MCDIDSGAVVDFSADSDIGNSVEDSFDVTDDIGTSDIEGMSDVEGVPDTPEEVECLQDMEEPFASIDIEEIGDYSELSEFDGENDQNGIVEEFEDMGGQPEHIENQEEMIDNSDTLSLSELDDVEPELTFTQDELQELYEEYDEEPDFRDKMEELISSGRVAISDMEDIDASDEEGVKVLTREITSEIQESREHDTEEVLDNYRENLQERGVSENQIEEFIEHERESINAEYESLDAGEPSENIYQMPNDWDAVADSLENTDNDVSVENREWGETFQLDDGEEIYEEATDSCDVTEEYNQNVEGGEALGTYQTLSAATRESEEEYLGDLQQRLTEGYGIPEDSPELESLMQNEQRGWEEIHADNSSGDIQENLEEVISMDDIPAEEMENVTEGIDSIELGEISTVMEDNSVEGMSEGIEENISEAIEEGNISLDESNVINDGSAESMAVEENLSEIDEDTDMIEETLDIVEETPDIEEDLSIDTNETQEIGVNYDEIYGGISQECLEQGFEDVDIYEDSERLDVSLENFEANNWENLSVDDQKQSMNDLAEYIEEVIGFDNPPRIEYYNNPREGDYGGYNAQTNTLSVNEFMLYNNSEAADTVAHELWHAHQHECAVNPLSARDYQYQYNFENYICPEMGHESYESQLVEAEARAFAAQFKGRLAEIGSGRR